MEMVPSILKFSLDISVMNDITSYYIYNEGFDWRTCHSSKIYVTRHELSYTVEFCHDMSSNLGLCVWGEEGWRPVVNMRIFV
jgi:hypothetical protein